VPGARAFRRHLATAGVKPDAGVDVLRQALMMISDASHDFTDSAAA
jgi:tRNA-dihydrouridine synthase A